MAIGGAPSGFFGGRAANTLCSTPAHNGLGRADGGFMGGDVSAAWR